MNKTASIERIKAFLNYIHSFFWEITISRRRGAAVGFSLKQWPHSLYITFTLQPLLPSWIAWSLCFPFFSFIGACPFKHFFIFIEKSFYYEWYLRIPSLRRDPRTSYTRILWFNQHVTLVHRIHMTIATLWIKNALRNDNLERFWAFQCFFC